MSTGHISEPPTIIPEQLTDEELIEKLNESFPMIRNLKSMPREQLTKLFIDMLSPLPQREYRRTHRGRLLTERRVRSGLHAKPPNEASSLSTSLENDRISAKRTKTEDRLKPPPDISSAKIQISTKTSSDKISKTRTANIEPNVKTTPISIKRPPSTIETSEKQETGAGKPKRVKITWP